MESLAAEIESAIYTQLNTTSKIERKTCEDVILKFRNLSQPYDLCKFILGQSKNPLLLYEVGKCLSNAVVREWTRVFCPPGYDLTISTPDSKPHQLLCFLLQWVASVGNEVQNVGRQSILTAASALVKRAAAEQAQMESKKMTSRIQTILSPPNDPGSASPIMSSFMHELGQLLAPSASFQQDESRISFGLSILTAFIDEMANCGDYTKLNIPLEAHIFMQSRFEDFELLEILKMLLRLTNSLLVQAEWPGSVVETEFNFRLVHCLEAVTSWNFLPNHIIDLSCLRSTGGRSRDSDFRPRDKWVCVLGHEALPSTLGLLFNLHGRLRESASLGSGTLSCLISISNLQGSLVAQLVPKTHTIHVDQLAEIKESSPLVAHLTTMMECLSRWLPLREQRSASFECLLLRQSTNASDDKVDDCLAEFNVAPFSKALTIASMYQHMPRLECLRSYELPLLSELTVNLLRQLFEVFSSIESVICGSDNETRGADENRLRQIISRIFFYLGAMRKFLNLVCTVLSKCLLLEASNGDGEGKYDAKDAHEASERLFSYLADVSSLFRQIDGVGGDVFSPDGNTAISLTTGPTAVKDQFTELLKRGCNRVRQEMNREQVCLIRLYFASHLAAPVGFRAPEAEGRDEEWNLSIDMADQCAYEDSLFAIGQFSGSNGVASMAGVIDLLAGLLEERANLLTNMSPASNQISALMEDIHWLLLLSGHILVIGPSQTGSSRGGQPTWDSEFAIPDCIWKIGKGETHTQQDVESGQRFLVSATENTPVPANASNIPSLIRLFAVLFRLLRIQTSPRTGVDHIGSDHIGSDHVGSAQLTEDSLWLFVRICLTYLSTNQSDVSSSEEIDSTGRSLAHMILKGRSNHHSSVFPSCVASLVLSSRLAMSVWRGEPNITAYASCLLSVIARHSLVHLKQEGCPLWVELCGMVAGANAVSQTWSLLSPETLTELIDSCTRGCWSLRHANVTLSLSTNSGPRNDLFFQFVGEIRARVECVMQPVTATQQQEETESGLESILAVVSGLARALRWIISSNSDDTNDLTAWFWTSFFLPILKNCATQLFQKFHMSHYLVSRILNLFYEIADNCLLYLTNCPVNITHDEVAAAYLLTNTQIAFNKNSGSTQFLTLTSILCAQYAQANCKKISCVAGDQERVSEIKLLLNLLQYFLGHEFELRLFGSAANGVEQTDPTQLCLTTVDVTLMCIGHLLPLLTASVLAVPNISSGFYSLLAYALEIRAEGLGHLISANQSGIADLGRLIRSGLFHSTSSNVSISCLEVVTYLCEFCLDARCGILTASAAVLANRIIEELPLDGNLLHELLSLAIRPEFAVEMEETLATCILCLAFLIPDVFQELIQQWLSGHTEGETRMRLQMAFVKLSVPIERALLHQQTTHQSALKRPTRGGRAEFQELFHAFILTVRAFLCSF